MVGTPESDVLRERHRRWCQRAALRSNLSYSALHCGEDRARQIARTRELRPVPGRQVHVGGVLHLRKFGEERCTARHPLLQLGARELAADHGDGYVVASLFAEL